MEVFMYSAENLTDAKRRTLSQSSYEGMDEAIGRGSPVACLSSLLVAIVIAITLWFGDFASESAWPAWEVIRHEAILLRQDLGIGFVHRSSGQATAPRANT